MKVELKIKKRIKRIIRVCKRNKDKNNEIFYRWILQEN